MIAALDHQLAVAALARHLAPVFDRLPLRFKPPHRLFAAFRLQHPGVTISVNEEPMPLHHYLLSTGLNIEIPG
jgi:hypothetical protein